MQEEDLKRYSRQMTLPQFGYDGQQALQDAHALIIGLGGLGSPATLYLAAAGIGSLTLVDFDRVDISNLHRQILYDTESLGQKKTAAAKKRLEKFNQALTLNTVDRKLSTDELNEYVAQADVVLDCSDNFTTRYAVNLACIDNRTPLVSGAAIRLEGQIAVFNNTPNSPCYACLYPDAPDEDLRCSDLGVLGPVAGIIGSMQALEAIKCITAIGELLDSRLLVIDAEIMESRMLKLHKDSQCTACT